MIPIFFDGRMIGPGGNGVVYPRWFFLILIQTHRRVKRIAKECNSTFVPVLVRDDQTGRWRVMPEMYRQLGGLLQTVHFNPYKRVHAASYSFASSLGGGRRLLVDLLECGIGDIVQRREMGETETDSMDRHSGCYTGEDPNVVVREVIRNRRWA